MSGPGGARAVSLMVHVPFCRQKCAYCRLYGVSGREDAFDPFLAAIAREWEIVRREEALEGRAVASVLIGGGTPSLLGGDRLTRLLETIRRGVALDPGCEITLEAYPDSVDRALAEEIGRAGYTRINVGVHSFADADLAALDRGYRGEQVRRALAEVREGGCRNLGIDLVYGVPGATLAGWEGSLDAARGFACEHIACRPLTPQEETLEEHLLRGRFEESVLEENLFHQARAAERILTTAGYEQYEVSLFARPGFHCRHEERLLRRQPGYGLGPGAHSFDGVARWRNAPDLDAYLESLLGANLRPPQERYRLSEKNHAQEIVLLGLRRVLGLAWSEIAPWLDAAGLARLQRRAAVLGTQGFVRASGEGVALAPEAYFVSHSVALELIRALEPEQP
jgi:oxygen-independent coproporphyrinogen III oxidase